MNRLKSFFSMCAVFFLITQICVAQNRVERTVVNKVEKITDDEFPFDTETSKGARVYLVKKPGSKMLKAINDGLTELFAIARKNRYSKRLNYSD
ncbi:MAG: hypothetical protein M3Q33_14760 [Acidobacteriota bacterium]|nr:hypothetical protein [Acidobacteriota bacterium]